MPGNDPCNPYRVENVLSNADLGVNGLTISAKAYNTTGDCEGGWPGLQIEISYQSANSCEGYYFRQYKQRDDGPKEIDGYPDSPNLNAGRPEDNIINCMDRPSFSSEADAFGTIEHHWTGETTLYNNNNEKVFTLNWGFNVCNYGIGPNGYSHILNVEPFDFVMTVY